MPQTTIQICPYCHGSGIINHYMVEQAGTAKEKIIRLHNQACDGCGGSGKGPPLKQKLANV